MIYFKSINRIVLLILLIIFYSTCYGQDIKELKGRSTRIQVIKASSDTNQFYFPLEVFRDTSLWEGNDIFRDTWYSKPLSAMREPIIYIDKSQSEIYRFTWLRTFHNPIAIRIEKISNEYFLYWKVCNGAGGYEPGELMLNQKRVLDKSNWDEFISKLNQIDFWNLPTNIATFGLDGSQWILEGKISNKYHVVDRWTPDKSSKFYICCDYLISLTDLRFKDRDKY